MELREIQLMERNKYAMRGNIIIAIFSLIGALTAFAYYKGAGEIIQAAACVIDILISVALFAKFKYSESYRHVVFLSIAGVYVVILLTASAPGYYALLYPIALLLTIYADRRVTIIGTVLAVVVFIIFCIRMFIKSSIDVGEIFRMLGYVVPSICIVFFSTSIYNKHTRESLEAAGKSGEAAMKVSEEIVKLADDLNSKFQSAQEVSEKLNTTSDASNNSISEIAENTKINAQAIEKQTVMTSDIQKSIRTALNEAKQMEDVSKRTNDRVNEGVLFIEQLKTQASQVEQISNETNITTKQLNESIRAVQEITETILGISSQTNLLALNASIEAARAGEAGKGFAVVADEIRTLSEGTREATQKISEIINRLTADAETASQNMSESAKYARMQNELITQTGDKLSQIKEDSGALSEGVLQVSRSIEVIDDANSKIVDSITNLSATFQQVAAATETSLTLSDSSMEAIDSMNGLLKDISDIAVKMESVAGK